MIIGKPAPFVSAFVAAVDEAIRVHQPSRGMSAMQRTWLAFCVTAVLGWCPTSIAQRGKLATPSRTTHGLQGLRPLLGFAFATRPLSEERGASVQASKSCTST